MDYRQFNGGKQRLSGGLAGMVTVTETSMALNVVKPEQKFLFKVLHHNLCPALPKPVQQLMHTRDWSEICVYADHLTNAMIGPSSDL